MTIVLSAIPSPTWEDVKQLTWGLVCVVPFIALFAWGARVLVGNDAAIWLGIGVMGVAVVTYGSVIVVSLLISYVHDAVQKFLDSRPHP